MLAAPCIPPATGSVFSCILSCSKGVVHTLRLDATMFRFSQALVRRLPDGRLLVVIQHVLWESQVGVEGMARPGRPGHPPAVSLRSPASPLRWSEGGRCGCPAQVGEGRQPAPVPAPGIPRVLASLARAPFAGSERGRVFALALPFWIPACAGMTGWGGNDGGGMACPRRPGHPPAVSLRSSASPLRWSEGGR